jgi:hypothetical protein
MSAYLNSSPFTGGTPGGRANATAAVVLSPTVGRQDDDVPYHHTPGHRLGNSAPTPRETTHLGVADYHLFRHMERAGASCQLASAHGGRPSVFWSHTSSGSHCPAPHPTFGANHTSGASAADMVLASTEARQSVHRFAESDPFSSPGSRHPSGAGPHHHSGWGGSKLMGAPPLDSAGSSCDPRMGGHSTPTSACGLPPASDLRQGGSMSRAAHFFADVGVAPGERAVYGARTG